MDPVTRVAIDASIRLALSEYRQRNEQDTLTSLKASNEAVASLKEELAHLSALVASKANIADVYNRDFTDQHISSAVAVSSSSSQDAISMLSENISVAVSTLTSEIASLKAQAFKALNTKIAADEWPSLLRTAKAEAQEAARSAFFSAAEELQEETSRRLLQRDGHLTGNALFNNRPLAIDRLGSAWCPLPHVDGAVALFIPGSFSGTGSLWHDVQGRASIQLPEDFLWDGSAGAFVAGETNSWTPSLRLPLPHLSSPASCVSLFMRLPLSSSGWSPASDTLPLVAIDGDAQSSISAAAGLVLQEGLELLASSVLPLDGLAAGTPDANTFVTVQLNGLRIPDGTSDLEFGAARRADLAAARWPPGTTCGAIFVYERELTIQELARNERWAAAYWPSQSRS